jgi:hypothetical protein
MKQIFSKSPEPVFDKIFIFFLKSDLMDFEILKYNLRDEEKHRTEGNDK